MGPGPNIMFTLVPIFIGVIGVIVVCGVIFAIIKGIKQWSFNNNQPVLTVASKVVSKRSKVSSSMNNPNDDHMHSSTTTTYYITFEVESGDRIEFSVRDREFGLLAEGDHGKLTFQGTRYLGFNRDNMK